MKSLSFYCAIGARDGYGNLCERTTVKANLRDKDDEGH